MRTGDKVRHKYANQVLTVAHVSGKVVAWCGYPDGVSSVDDCELVEACSDEEHWSLVEEVARDGTGRRQGHCIRRLIQRRQRLYELKAGDTVKHIPSGTTMPAAYLKDGRIYFHSIPRVDYDMSECEVIKQCGESESLAMLHRISKAWARELSVECERLYMLRLQELAERELFPERALLRDIRRSERAKQQASADIDSMLSVGKE